MTSSPAGIECSNIPGDEAGECASPFPAFETVELTATNGSGSVFSSWTGDDPFGGFLGPTCNEGSANPCATFDPVSSLGSPNSTHITATFDCTPPIASPLAVTGASSEGADFSLRILEGEIDPEGCGLDESYFEYGTSTEYGSTTPTVPGATGIGEGSSPVAVSAEAEPLEPETTYHYRLVASSIGGTSKGEDRTFTTGPAIDECPDEESRERRAEQGIAALLLPDCMALEMASPPQKHGAAAYLPSVSADGSRVSFISQAALGEDPPAMLSVGGATYVAGHGESGWTSEMTVPDLDPRIAEQWEATSERRPSFTPDFSHWLGTGATEGQKSEGIMRAYEVGLGGFFRPLSEPLVPISFSAAAGSAVRGSNFQAASADHSHLYFALGSKVTYFPGDPSLAGSGKEPANVYLAHSGAGGQPAPLELLQRDRDDKVWGGNCGARLGGIGSVGGESVPNGNRGQGAVSADGGRTYLSARAAQPQEGSCDTANKLRILERLETPSGPQIVPLFASECGRPALPDPPGLCKELSGDDLYQGASLDQSRVYFTTNRQLVDSDVDGSGAGCSLETAVAGCDLYLYDRARPVGERLIQVSAGEDVAGEHEAGKEADVFNGITAISADGSHVYFVAAGVLTGDTNPASESAQLGEPNLYMWDAESEETAFLGTLDPEDGISIFEANFGQGLWGGEGTWRNGAYPVPALSAAEQGGERGEEGGDGRMLVFESRAELTENDGDGSRLDVYRYDAEAPSLECLSCAPGSSPSEPDDAPLDVVAHGEYFVPPGTDFAEHQRWVSEDGEEVGFSTPQGLLPGDVNGAVDGYLWDEGELFRLPGKPFSGFSEADGPFLSHDGSTVAFVTSTPLLPQDGDTAADVYVARIGGGYPKPPSPEPCELGSPDPSKRCQEPGREPPAPLATSEAPGTGNPPQRHPCAKGKVRRHGRCVPKPRPKHKRQANKRHSSRQTDTHRRAAR